MATYGHKNKEGPLGFSVQAGLRFDLQAYLNSLGAKSAR